MKIFEPALVLSLLLAGSAQAAVIDWADWTDSDLSSANGTVGSVGVEFTGNLEFAQLASGSMVGGGGGNPSATTNYWTEENGSTPYTGSTVVDNAPTAYELLGFDAQSTNTIAFDSAVQDPLMAFVSIGRPGVTVTYDFDTPFTVLSEGEGYWGDGSYNVLSGDVLEGNELHAVIQFQGSISEINWTATDEYWHGLTVGVASVPEPGTFGLLGAGLLGLAISARRRIAGGRGRAGRGSRS